MRRDAGGREREAPKPRCEYPDGRGQQAGAAADNDSQRRQIAPDSVRRPPQNAANIWGRPDYRFRLQKDNLTRNAQGKDCGELHADDKTCPDHGGDDLRRQPRALGTDRAEQPGGQRDRDSDRDHGQCWDDRVGAEPAHPAEPGQNVDERRRQRQ